MIVWRVPESVPPSDHRFNYRLVHIVGNRRVVGYDNERGKGDDVHRGEVEQPFVFTTIDDFLARFVAEVEDLWSGA